ncbi:outer membrane beta-barrel protein, partial [Labrys sp. KB_33_2]|uniref:outer membrane beta-barrel protein n=1 Tax=Labrys sp. KB_33_2 TaxID=3237479 RepID=UPI003F8F0FBF
RLSGGVIYASFDRPDDRAEAKSGFPMPFNGTDYYVALRATTMLTPQIYAFIEGGADFHRYDKNVKGDSVYHMTTGLGSELIRLVRGEVYVGYQTRSGSRRISGSSNQPAFGGRITYYPTQYITIAASADQSLSFSQTPVLLPSGNGSVSQAMQSASGRTFQSRIQADYALSQLWSAYVQAGYGQTRYNAIS